MKLQVGVKVLLKNNKDEILLLRRTQTFQDEHLPYWDIPGGRIEPSETLDFALQREVFEETGLEINDDVTLLAAQDIMVPANDLHVIRLTYSALGSGDVVISDEHQEAVWVKITEAMKLHLDPYLQAVIEKL